jgi:Protein of unknown function (DUF3140)
VKPTGDATLEEFGALVNMSAAELSAWLRTSDSRRVGWKGSDGTLRESVGHASGRRIVQLLAKDSADLTESDLRHMRKTIGFIRRHTAQEPANRVSSRWRYSLMNWGHDPLKQA